MNLRVGKVTEAVVWLFGWQLTDTITRWRHLLLCGSQQTSVVTHAIAYRVYQWRTQDWELSLPSPGSPAPSVTICLQLYTVTQRSTMTHQRTTTTFEYNTLVPSSLRNLSYPWLAILSAPRRHWCSLLMRALSAEYTHWSDNRTFTMTCSHWELINLHTLSWCQERINMVGVKAGAFNDNINLF